jgi:hypothetical protein
MADFGSAPESTIFCNVAAHSVVDSEKYGCGVNFTLVFAMMVLNVSS